MKQRISLLLLAFVAASMLFSSCKKDQSELILGTWNLIGANSYRSINYGDLDNTEYYTDATVSMQFKSDGTMVITKTDEDGEVDTDTVSYTVADGVLTLVDDESDEIPVKMNIDKLTDKDLILTHTDSYDMQGMTYTKIIHFELTR